MTCPSQLDWSMYADGALTADEAARNEAHLEGCAACRALLAGLGEERRMLEVALRAEDAPVPIPEPRIRLGRPPIPAPRGALPGGSLRGGPLAAAAAIIALASSGLVLGGLLPAVRLPEPLAWLNPFTPAGVLDIAIGFLVLVVMEGESMLASMTQLAGAAALAVLAAAATLVLARRRPGGVATAFSAALAAAVLASPAEALEIRRAGEVLTVPAGETIDDTLFAFADSIEIDGNVNGDLIAFGRRIVIRGSVQGQIVTGARQIDIVGDVGGSVLGFADTLAFADGRIARNLFAFGRDVTTRSGASVGGNAVVFGSQVTLEAPVDIDVVGFAGQLELANTVGGDVTAHAGEVEVLGGASIRGDVVAHVGSEDALRVSPAATIGGTVRTEVEEDFAPRRPEVTTGGFLSQFVRFAAAFVTGLIVLWLVPGLRLITIDNAGEAVTAAGLGLVTLIAVPIIALLTAITLIGLPIAFVGVLLWLASLYFAKILLAHFVGRKLLERVGHDQHFALALAVGLLLVFIAVKIPLLGMLINFVLTITGLGMLVVYVWGLFQGRAYGDDDRLAEEY